MKGLANQIRPEDPEEHPCGAANQAKHDGFTEKLKLDGFLCGSHCYPHADLARTLRYGNKHHVHDADSPHDQGNRRDGDQQNRESLAGIELCLDDVLWIADVEVIFFFGTQMMAIAEHRCCFLSGHFNGVL